MKVTIVAGTRPNFIKAASILKEAQRRIAMGENWFEMRFVHTGQHYDPALSDLIMKELNLPDTDNNLMAGSGTHAEQTAEIMIKFEKELLQNKPDLVMVFGDVNSTMACAIAAKKLQIKVAHIESGLRSGDTGMPEEINRILTDSITDYHFTTSEAASENLIKEGKSPESIFFVGNTMIDTLLDNVDQAKQTAGKVSTPEPYLLLTLHRPVNVDDRIKLKALIEKIVIASHPFKIIFPVHPRLQGLFSQSFVNLSNLLILPAQSYFDFLTIMINSRGIITDSGGISEESTVLNIPCITLRNSTERPETIDLGTNVLWDGSEESLHTLIEQIKNGQWKQSRIPELWDGKTAGRIWDCLYEMKVCN